MRTSLKSLPLGGISPIIRCRPFLSLCTHSLLLPLILALIMVSTCSATRIMRVSLIAGTGTNTGATVDGIPATSSPLRSPRGLFMDSSNDNIYIVELSNNRVRMVSGSTALIQTIAGNGTQGFSGDGLSATLAMLNAPTGIWMSTSHAIIVCDTYNRRLRAIDSNGIIRTIAGSNSSVFRSSDENKPATAVGLGLPQYVTGTTTGYVYFTDSDHDRVRMITPAGLITTIAGGGTDTSGYGDPLLASLPGLAGIALSSSGKIYVADSSSHRILGISSDFTSLTTAAGNGTTGHTSVPLPATSSALRSCKGVGVTPGGDMYIADMNNQLLRFVDPNTGIMEDITLKLLTAVNQTLTVYRPHAIFVRSNRRILFSSDLHQVHLIDLFAPTAQPTGQPSSKPSSIAVFRSQYQQSLYYSSQVLLGSTVSGYNGEAISATAALAYMPWGIQDDTVGNIYFSDRWNHRIRKIAAGTNIVSTYIGNGTAGFAGDGQPYSSTNVMLKAPFGLFVASNGIMLIADQINCRIRTVNSGIITTIAGNGLATAYSTADENQPATSVSISFPYHVTAIPGVLYIADTGHNLIRKASGAHMYITTIAGGGLLVQSSPTLAVSALLSTPTHIWLASGNVLYISEHDGHMVRKLTESDGMLYTVAGTGNAGYNAISSRATSADLHNPSSVWVDSVDGTMFIVDQGNHRIRVVDGVAGSIADVVVFNQSTSTVRFSSPCTLFARSKQNLLLTNGNTVMQLNLHAPTSQPTSQPSQQPTSRPTFWNTHTLTYRLQTYAGVLGTSAYNGDGYQASASTLDVPVGVCDDTVGNIYIADQNHARIRQVNAITGLMSTYAGSGFSGFDGDGSQATSANVKLKAPRYVWMSTTNTLYIADQGNHRIRVVFNQGIIHTFAGNGSHSYSSNDENMPATSVGLYYPACVMGFANSIFIADTSHNRIRRVDLSTGLISTFAGGGTSGWDNVAATAASLQLVTSLWVTSIGEVYLTDTGHHYVRKVTVSGIITFFAGKGLGGFSTDRVLATHSNLNSPQGLWVDPVDGTVYIADTNNARIRAVSASTNIITTIAGMGTNAVDVDGKPATSSTLMQPVNIFGRSAQQLFVSESNTATTLRLLVSTSPTSQPTSQPSSQPTVGLFQRNYGLYSMEVIAGNGTQGFFGEGIPASRAMIFGPWGMCLDSSGNLLFADRYNNRIRKIDLVTNIITTFMGNGNKGYDGDGNLYSDTSVMLTYPFGIWMSTSSLLLIADHGNHRIRTVSTNGLVNTVAGNGDSGYSSAHENMLATNVTLNNPTYAIQDSTGMMFIVDSGNNRIRQVTVSGFITTIIGGGANVLTTSGSILAASVVLNLPNYLWLKSNGDKYISDTGSNKVFKVSNGMISILAGNGSIGYTAHVTHATSTGLNHPIGLWINPNDHTVWIADKFNGNIRIVNEMDGSIQTLPLANTVAQEMLPIAIVPSQNPNQIFISTVDSIVKLSLVLPTGQPTSQPTSRPTKLIVRKSYGPYSVQAVAGNDSAGFHGESSPATSALIYGAWGICLDASGNILFSDRNSNRIRKIDASTNIITTFMGNGTRGFAGDGRRYSDTSVMLSISMGITIQGGNVYYIADRNNNRVRMIGPGGFLSTYAGGGNGDCTIGQENIVATTATLCWPTHVVFDSAGVIYIAEYNNNRIRKVSAGIISTVAGGGSTAITTGSILATNCALSLPIYLLVRNDDIFIANIGSNRVLKLSGGMVSPFAGDGSTTFSDGYNVATSTGLSGPIGMWIDPKDMQSIWIADRSNNAIRIVNDADGTMQTVIIADNALSSPLTLAASSADHLYVATTSKILKLSLPAPTSQPSSQPSSRPTSHPSQYLLGITYRMSLFAGNATGDGFDGDGKLATLTKIAKPSSIWQDRNGSVYFTDTEHFRIRKIDGVSNIVTTVVGSGVSGFGGDGLPATSTSALISDIRGLWIATNFDLYFTQPSQYRVRMVTFQTGILHTTAGNGSSTSTVSPVDENQYATSVALGGPHALMGDSVGNLYIADTYANRIRVIDKYGRIHTVAGGGVATGSGIAATSAIVSNPMGVWVTSAGVLYFSDSLRHQIRLVANGIVKTVIGTTVAAFNGDNRPGTSTAIKLPRQLWVDSTEGSIYFADQNLRIRVLDSQTGLVFTIAGHGLTPATTATEFADARQSRLYFPIAGCMVHGKSSMLIVDRDISRIYKLTANVAPTSQPSSQPSSQPTSHPTSFYHNSPTAYSVSILAGNQQNDCLHFMTKSAKLSAIQPFNIYGDDLGNLFFTEYNCHMVRKLDAITNNVTLVAGNGESTSSGDGYLATHTSVSLNRPYDLWVSSLQEIFVTEFYGHLVRKIDSASIISTFAGNGSSLHGITQEGLMATASTLANPKGIRGDEFGNIYVVDSIRSSIRKILKSGRIYTYAGGGSLLPSANNWITATSAKFNGPSAIWMCSKSEMYFSMFSQSHIYKMVGSNITLVAGSNRAGYDGEGLKASSSKLNGPRGIYVDCISKSIFVAEFINRRVRRIDETTGRLYTVAGVGMVDNGVVEVDGLPAADLFVIPTGIYGSSSSSIVFTDFNTRTLQRLEIMMPTGQPTSQPSSQPTSAPSSVWFQQNAYAISTYAGIGTAATSSEGVSATSAGVQVAGMFCDTNGVLYMVESNFHRIRKIDPITQRITTVAGQTRADYSGDGLTATSPNVTFHRPIDIWLSSIGEIFVSDAGNNRIRKIDVTSIITTYAGNGTIVAYSSQQEGRPATQISIINPSSLRGKADGTLFIVDTGNHRLRMVSEDQRIYTITGGGVFVPSPHVSMNAVLVSVGSIFGLCISHTGVIYLGNTGAFSQIYKIVDGNITVVAGTGAPGYSGNNLMATTSKLNAPRGLWIDNTDGTLFIADSNNNLLRALDSNTGRLVTIAGTRSASGSLVSDGMDATKAAFQPFAIAGTTNQALFVSDVLNYVRLLRPTHLPTSQPSSRPSTSPTTALVIDKYSKYNIIGTQQCGPNTGSGVGVSMPLDHPYGLALDPLANVLYLSDQMNNRILKYHLYSHLVELVAGNGSAGFAGEFVNASSNSVMFSSPRGVWYNPDGLLFIADYYNHRIRMINVSSGGEITTLAGNGSNAVHSISDENVNALLIAIRCPVTIASNARDRIYFVDGESMSRVRMMSLITKLVHTIAGGGTIAALNPTAALNARFAGAQGLWVLKSGDILLADPAFHRLCRISAGVVYTLAGTSYGGFNGDRLDALSTDLRGPRGIWVDDSESTVFFADSSNFRIRAFSFSNRIVHTIAGNGISRVDAESQEATAVGMRFVYSIVGLGKDTLFFAEFSGCQVCTLVTEESPYYRHPSSVPSRSPTSSPSSMPISQPSSIPTDLPSPIPSSTPTSQPSSIPTDLPSSIPSSMPTSQPSSIPTDLPSSIPSSTPTSRPSLFHVETPTPIPTQSRSIRTDSPSRTPHVFTGFPTVNRLAPTSRPSERPTNIAAPSSTTVRIPSSLPSTSLSSSTEVPSAAVRFPLSTYPTSSPSLRTAVPTSPTVVTDTAVPTVSRLAQPTESPTSTPWSPPPTSCPTLLLTESSSFVPTDLPTRLPSATSVPTVLSTDSSVSPTNLPTGLSTTVSTVTNIPTTFPSRQTAAPIATDTPSLTPVSTQSPSFRPSSQEPSFFVPTHTQSSVSPSFVPSATIACNRSESTALHSAVFMNNAQQLLIFFSHAIESIHRTNGSFACSSLFAFSCAEIASCQWIDTQTVSASLHSLPSAQKCVKANDWIGLRDVSVLSTASSTSCPINDDVSLLIRSSVDSVSNQIPVVILRAASSTTRCASWTIDWSSSTGSYGRSWSNVSVTVLGMRLVNGESLVNSSDIATVQSIVNSQLQSSSGQGVLVISSSLLERLSSLSLSVTLCNVLNLCSWASREVTILSPSLTQIPPVTVSIAGAPQRVIFRNDSLSLSAVVSIASCLTGTQTQYSIRYSWALANVLTNGTTVMSSLTSLSKTPSVLSLAAFTLEANRNYTIVVQAVVSLAKTVVLSTTANASVWIHTRAASLIPVIRNGVSQQFYADRSLLIDASASYDQNTTPSLSSSSSWPPLTVQCTWSTGSTVPIVIFVTKASNMSCLIEVLSSSIFAVNTAVTGTVRLTLLSSQVLDSRSSVVDIAVTIVPSNSPLIQWTTSDYASKTVNSQDTLKLQASITLPARFVGNATWSARVLTSTGTASVDLSKISLTPLQWAIDIPTTVSRTVQTAVLTLSQNALEAGRTYQFSLECSQQTNAMSLKSRNTLSMVVNAPPSLGYFGVSPNFGWELTTPFVFFCSNWFDVDLPLQYAFGFVTVSGQRLLIHMKSETALLSGSKLPAGNPLTNFTLSCFATVWDNLGAYNDASTTFPMVATHSNSTVSSASQRASLMLQANASMNRADTNQLHWYVATGANIVNDVDCTQTVNCTALHRNACSRVVNTCGTCWTTPSYDVLWIGDAGDANSQCMAWSIGDAVPSSTGNSPKTCPNDCSQRGQCAFVSSLSSALTVTTCAVGDVSCKAVCICETDRFGDDCSQSLSEWQVARQLRESLVESLNDLWQMEDVSAVSIESSMQSMQAICQQPIEVSAVAANGILHLVNEMINGMESLSSTTPLIHSQTDSLTDILSSIVESIAVHDSDSNSSATATPLSQTAEIKATLTEQLTRLTVVLGQDMSSSQEMVSSVADNVKLSVMPINPIEASTLVSIELAKSTTEVVLSSSTPRLTLTLTSNANATNASQVTAGGQFLGVHQLPLNFVNVSGILTSLNTTRQNNVTALSSLLSTMRIDSSFLSCVDSHSCQSSITFPRPSGISTSQWHSPGTENNRSSFAANSSSSNVTTVHCPAHNVSIQTVTCGTTRYAVPCNGSAVSIAVHCPVLTTSPTCAVASSFWSEQQSPFETSATRVCEVLSVSTDNVTCSCHWLSAVSSSSRRALSSASNQNATTLSVSYLAMLQSTSSTFLVTIHSAPSALTLQNVRQSWAVISVLVAFVIVSLLVLAFAQSWDSADDLRWKHEEMVSNSKMYPLLAAFESDVLSQKENKRKTHDSLHSSDDHSHSSRSQLLPADVLMTLAAEALPESTIIQAALTRVTLAMKQRHRWLELAYHYSPRLSRRLRVLSLATNIVIMLFVQSITYSLSQGDDGTCQTWHSAQTCTAQPSDYHTGASKCYWNAQNQSCNYVQPSNSLMIMFFVAMLSALATTPLALANEWLIFRVLASSSSSSSSAQTSTKKSKQHRLNAVKPVLLPIVPARDEVVGGGKTPSHHNKTGTHNSTVATVTEFKQQVTHEYSQLKSSLRAYHAMLPPGQEKKDFEGLWGLQSNGEFRLNSLSLHEQSSWLNRLCAVCSRKDDIPRLIQQDIERCLQLTLDEEQRSLWQLQPTRRSQIASSHSEWTATCEVQRNKRLLFHFQKDLLIGMSEHLLYNQDLRYQLYDNGEQHSLSRVQHNRKALKSKDGGSLIVSQPQSQPYELRHFAVYSLLLIENVTMMFYVLLFGLSQSASHQKAWAQSFVIWLFMDILFFATLLVLVYYVLLPMIMSNDVAKVHQKVCQCISQYQQQHPGLQGQNSEENTPYEVVGEKKQQEESIASPVGVVSASSSSSPSSSPSSFNAVPYFFVSHRLATHHSTLAASAIVLDYRSVWPRQSYLPIRLSAEKVELESSQEGIDAIVSLAVQIGLFFLSKVLMSPVQVQNMIVQLLSTTLISYVILIHVQLFAIFPALVVIPSLSIVLLVLFFKLMRWKRCSARVTDDDDEEEEEEEECVEEEEGDEENAAVDVENNRADLDTSALVADKTAVANGLPTAGVEYALTTVNDVLTPATDAVRMPLPSTTAHVTRRASLQEGLRLLQLAQQSTHAQPQPPLHTQTQFSPPSSPQPLPSASSRSSSSSRSSASSASSVASFSSLPLLSESDSPRLVEKNVSKNMNKVMNSYMSLSSDRPSLSGCHDDLEETNDFSVSVISSSDDEE